MQMFRLLQRAQSLREVGEEGGRQDFSRSEDRPESMAVTACLATRNRAVTDLYCECCGQIASQLDLRKAKTACLQTAIPARQRLAIRHEVRPRERWVHCGGYAGQFEGPVCDMEPRRTLRRKILPDFGPDIFADGHQISGWPQGETENARR